MTGTGTEQDPFIIQTAADLFEAAGTEGAYGLIPGDIDVSRDTTTDGNDGEQWRMGTARTLELACEQLYTDATTGRVAIRGLISTAPHFIKCTRHAEGGDPALTACILKDIEFVDCVFLRPDNGEAADIELTSDDGVGVLLQNTSFSVQMRNGDPEAARRTFLHGGRIYDSAFYAEGTPLAEDAEQSRVAGGALFLPTAAERCNIEAHGWKFTAGGRALVENTARSLVLADVTIQNGGDLLRGCASSLYAITPTRADPERGPQVTAQNCSGVNVLDATAWGSTIDLYAPNFHRMTTEDCKDAEKLRAVGFLP